MTAPTAPEPSPVGTSGAERIAAERKRQIEAEGWTPEHDASHSLDALALAAGCYALPPRLREFRRQAWESSGLAPRRWPWDSRFWKPSDDRVRELEKAGALIAAEIDRLLAQEAPDA